MPSTQEHIAKQHNTHLALSELQESQNSLKHADWIVTLAFYRALHAVDSYLAGLEIHPKGHPERNQCVRTRLSGIYLQYFALYRASRKARYEAYTYQDRPEDVATLVNDALSIEEEINTLLNAH